MWPNTLLFLCNLPLYSGIPNHHQHSDHHPVGADARSGDAPGAGEPFTPGAVGETGLEGAQTLVPGGRGG